MAHLYTKDGCLWQPGHPAWPNKKDGTAYQRISPQQKAKMEADGTWPTLFKSVTTYLDYCKGKTLLGWKEWQITNIAKAVYADRPADFNAALDRRIADERDAASNKGSDMHDVLARHLEAGSTPDEAFNPIEHAAVVGIRDWMAEQGLAPDMFAYEQGFSVEIDGLRFGGTADAVTNAITCYAPTYVIDFKTTTSKKDALPYADQPGQVAAYIRAHAPWAYDFDNCIGYNIYINQEDGQVYAWVRYGQEALQAGWRLFVTAYHMDEELVTLGKIKAVYR